MKEQRKHVRVAPARFGLACDLKLGSQVLPCLVLDESSGGWSMLITGLPEIHQNQAVAVRDDRGWYTARVVHAQPVLANSFLSSEGDDELSLNRKGGDEEGAVSIGAGERWLRLGIERQEKIAPPTAMPESLPRETTSSWHPLHLLRRLASLLS